MWRGTNILDWALMETRKKLRFTGPAIQELPGNGVAREDKPQEPSSEAGQCRLRARPLILCASPGRAAECARDTRAVRP